MGKVLHNCLRPTWLQTPMSQVLHTKKIPNYLKISKRILRKNFSDLEEHCLQKIALKWPISVCITFHAEWTFSLLQRFGIISWWMKENGCNDIIEVMQRLLVNSDTIEFPVLRKRLILVYLKPNLRYLWLSIRHEIKKEWFRAEILHPPANVYFLIYWCLTLT
jgi:hypothetical protein